MALRRAQDSDIESHSRPVYARLENSQLRGGLLDCRHCQRKTDAKQTISTRHEQLVSSGTPGYSCRHCHSIYYRWISCTLWALRWDWDSASFMPVRFPPIESHRDSRPLLSPVNFPRTPKRGAPSPHGKGLARSLSAPPNLPSVSPTRTLGQHPQLRDARKVAELAMTRVRGRYLPEICSQALVAPLPQAGA